MHLRTSLRAVAAAALAVGCVKPPEAITPQYVSHIQYQSLTCEQIAEEHARLSARLTELSTLQQENANTDAALFTVGMLLFWPALLAMPATVDRKGEIARLKGEQEALDRVALRKGCLIGQPDADTAATGTGIGAAP
ncbi:hypothetical protein FK498_01870 [Elioraea sp. Yellowstone]|jgi:hypothetical protein|uniref:hypothetical protein n=1 Tax=Elioraea sp. Yellowstone TaxID=2592070 RepID=UPI00114D8874|nr:hypothetical protein [Elioraea sp. Yellowstone]TQF84177.1 hypothetical protein FK498_01870 [Elioraea sp. Yellowstone]